MVFLTAEDILLIHSLIIDETGGSHGVRNRDILASLALTPQQEVFGKKLYPTVFDKAAVLARDVILLHPFVDGNKRTGMTAAAVFMEGNGYSLTAAEGEIESTALRIVNDRLGVTSIARWLQKHSVRRVKR